MNDLNEAIAGLHPICDSGGDQEACYSASSSVVSVIDDLVTSLNTLPVPERFQTAHEHLVRGLATERRGFVTRNNGLATGQDTDWVAGNEILMKGRAEIQEALREYPAEAGIPTPRD